ncbi:MAG: M4 family metallopeptidase, partial [Bacteroidales bacterium]|nr:M4 family metallopeptidase [Bacteroidales bacterium]
MQNQDDFVLKNKIKRENGSYYSNYKQFCKGIEVEGGRYILHFSKGNLTKANGHYVNTTGIDTSPKLTLEEASKSYAEFLQIPGTAIIEFLHGIVISEIEEVAGGDTTYGTKLCYKIDLIGNFADHGKTGYIDSQTGQVIKTRKRRFDYSATGTFSTLYSNSRTAGTQNYNSTFNLCDSSRNAIIHTWDLNNSDETQFANAVEFTDGNNTWTEAEHSDNHDQMALDIHWALQEIYDYFDSSHGLESFDDDNHDIDAYAHCNFYIRDNWGNVIDSTKDNAAYIQFANGYEALFFGDGESTFKPLAAFDAVTHEFGHAITNNFTGLDYGIEVQGAMHEGFSDIWGVVVENEVVPEKSHWKIGEEVMDNGKDCLRNIQYPESSTVDTKIADTFENDIYNDGGSNGRYEKSGILSHWFYLLSEGGSDINDNNDIYLVYGLGIDEAAKVVYEGQTGHFGDVDNYAEARTAMIDAADAIFNENSFQSLQVETAWYAVGVGTNPGQVTISGPYVVCYSGSTYTANNAPTGSAISWTKSSNLVISSGGSTTTPSIRASGSSTSGAGWVQANFTSNGYTTAGPRKNVWAGKPNPNNIEFFSDPWGLEHELSTCETVSGE